MGSQWLFKLFLILNVLYGAVHGDTYSKGSATFYIPDSGGACGYGDGFLLRNDYSPYNAALSTALFNKGQSCGACFELWCVDDPQFCVAGSVTVTATNFCPPNLHKPNNNGGWCNPPRNHFDLSLKAFQKIAVYRAGIVPVSYRRVPCKRVGGLRFSVSGNQYLPLFLVSNVGGAGEVVQMSVKGSASGWTSLRRNWGQNWESSNKLFGEALTFSVTNRDGRTVVARSVLPKSWSTGQTFSSNVQFY